MKRKRTQVQPWCVWVSRRFEEGLLQTAPWRSADVGSVELELEGSSFMALNIINNILLLYGEKEIQQNP